MVMVLVMGVMVMVSVGVRVNIGTLSCFIVYACPRAGRDLGYGLGLMVVIIGVLLCMRARIMPMSRVNISTN